MQFKFISSVVVCAILSLSSQHLLANTQLKPTCPSVSSIQTVNLDIAVRRGDWIVMKWTSRYDTQYNWRFSIGNFHAIDATDAFNQAKNSLATLTFVDGPIDYLGKWLCRYLTADGYKGEAFLLERM